MPSSSSRSTYSQFPYAEVTDINQPARLVRLTHLLVCRSAGLREGPDLRSILSFALWYRWLKTVLSLPALSCIILVIFGKCKDYFTLYFFLPLQILPLMVSDISEWNANLPPCALACIWMFRRNQLFHISVPEAWDLINHLILSLRFN